MKHLRKYNESFVEDDISHYLAYLIDEGFVFKSIGSSGGFADSPPAKVIFMEKNLSSEELDSIFKTGLTRKCVIIGMKGNPFKVYVTNDYPPKLDNFLSNFKSDLMNQIEFYAQDAADKILMNYSNKFEYSKIIVSFKRDIDEIRLQLIFTEKK